MAKPMTEEQVAIFEARKNEALEKAIANGHKMEAWKPSSKGFKGFDLTYVMAQCKLCHAALFVTSPTQDHWNTEPISGSAIDCACLREAE